MAKQFHEVVRAPNSGHRGVRNSLRPVVEPLECRQLLAAWDFISGPGVSGNGGLGQSLPHADPFPGGTVARYEVGWFQGPGESSHVSGELSLRIVPTSLSEQLGDPVSVWIDYNFSATGTPQSFSWDFRIQDRGSTGADEIVINEYQLIFGGIGNTRQASGTTDTILYRIGDVVSISTSVFASGGANGFTQGGGWLVISLEPDIIAHSLEVLNTGDVTVDYELMGALPRDTAIDLYWSDGEELGTNKLQANLVPYTTGTTSGRRSLAVPKDKLTAQPPWATHLVAALDYVEGNPEGVVNERDDVQNNRKAAIVVPDLAWTNSGLDWDRDNGGIRLSYDVLFFDLTESTDLAFYWASDTSLISSLGNAAPLLRVDPKKGHYPDSVDDLKFVPPPQGAKYLLAHLDNAKRITEYQDGESFNLAYLSLDLMLAPPVLDVSHSPAFPQYNQNYDVVLNVKNPMPIPFTFDLSYDWGQVYRDLTLRPRNGKKGESLFGSNVGIKETVNFGEIKTVAIGTFANAWDWIEPYENTVVENFANALLDLKTAGGELLEELQKVNLEALAYKTAARFATAISLIGDIGDVLKSSDKTRCGMGFAPWVVNL